MKKFMAISSIMAIPGELIINIVPDQKLILFRNCNTGKSILFDAKAM
jgi:hypothetical protein